MRTLRLTFPSCIALLACSALASTACSPGGDEVAASTGGTQSSGTDGGADQGQGGANGDGGATGNGGTTTGNGNGNTISVTVGTGSGQGGSGGGCGSSSLSAELIPVTMLIVFDKSGSMAEDGKWESATAALTSFVQNPEADGLGVGLKFFPKGGCNENDCDLAACAVPDVEPARLTDVVGAGDAQEQLLVTVASSGGTNTAFFIGSANAEAELLAALLSIQGQQIACELTIPDEDDIDPEKVNVSFTPDGAPEETIPQVPDAAGCGPSGGWYYDDPSSPTKITLCDATCEDIQGQSGELALVLGCETIVAN